MDENFTLIWDIGSWETKSPSFNYSKRLSRSGCQYQNDYNTVMVLSRSKNKRVRSKFLYARECTEELSTGSRELEIKVFQC